MMPVSLSARDRRAFLLAALSVLAACVYLLVLEPLQGRIASRRAGLESAQALNRHLQQVATESGALRAGAAPPAAGDRRSLLAIVDDTLHAAGLSAAIGEMTPEARDRVRVTLNKADFNALMQWLIDLEKRHGVAVERIAVSRGDRPGLAQVAVTLRSHS